MQNQWLEPAGLAKPGKTRRLRGMGPRLACEASVSWVFGDVCNWTDVFLQSTPGLLARYPDRLLTPCVIASTSFAIKHQMQTPNVGNTTNDNNTGSIEKHPKKAAENIVTRHPWQNRRMLRRNHWSPISSCLAGVGNYPTCPQYRAYCQRSQRRERPYWDAHVLLAITDRLSPWNTPLRLTATNSLQEMANTVEIDTSEGKHCSTPSNRRTTVPLPILSSAGEVGWQQPSGWTFGVAGIDSDFGKLRIWSDRTTLTDYAGEPEGTDVKSISMRYIITDSAHTIHETDIPDTHCKAQCVCALITCGSRTIFLTPRLLKKLRVSQGEVLITSLGMGGQIINHLRDGWRTSIVIRYMKHLARVTEPDVLLVLMQALNLVLWPLCFWARNSESIGTSADWLPYGPIMLRGYLRHLINTTFVRLDTAT